MDINPRMSELQDFQRRAVLLMCVKFLSDYNKQLALRDGAELEHCFECWSRAHIREGELREQVWRAALKELIKRRGI